MAYKTCKYSIVDNILRVFGLASYSIELLEKGDEWSAVIVDRVVVGKGKTAGDAVNAAVIEALRTEKKFAEAGLNIPKTEEIRPNSQSKIQNLQNQALRIFVRFGLPIFILTIAIIAIYFVIRGDIIDQITFIRDKLLEHAHNVRIAIERIADKP